MKNPAAWPSFGTRPPPFRLRLIALAVMLLPALLNVTGCATTPLPSPPLVIAPPAIPPLPPEARQAPLPAWCYPTCSAGLTTLRKSWRFSLTSPTPQAAPASASTTN